MQKVLQDMQMYILFCCILTFLSCPFRGSVDFKHTIIKWRKNENEVWTKNDAAQMHDKKQVV